MGRAEQIERRRHRGRSEPYDIKNLGEHSIWSRYAVRGPSGKTYEVIIHHLVDRIFHCQCPDFATNGLGTCKHVEAVLRYLEEEHAEDFAEAMIQGGQQGSLVFLDASTTPPGIRYRAYGPQESEAHLLAAGIFGDQGLLDPERLGEDFDRLVSEAEAHQITLDPAALEHVAWLREQKQRESDRGEAVLDFKRFRAAVVAQREPDTAPPTDDPALEIFVKNFGSLTDWELDGAEHLIARGRAILADDPELDKVHQTLAACEFLRLTGRVSRILLTCPGSRRQLWMGKVVSLCGIDPRIVGGATFEELARADADSPYAVASYNRLYRYLDKLKDTHWDVLVLDEVQRIKSWPAPTGQAIKSFKTTNAFALTSARLELRPEAFFYTVQLLDPYLLGPAWEFLDKHIVRDRRGAAIGAQNLPEALEVCGPLWLRRAASEVDTKGAPHSIDLYTDVTHFQHRQLDPLLRTLLAMARVQQVWSPAERKEVVLCLGKVRTICTLPELIKPERPGSPKLDELCHLVEDFCRDTSQSITVFCRLEVVADAIAKRLESTGIPITKVDATATRRVRRATVAALAKVDGPTVLVVSDEGSAELSLAAVTRIAIHAELPWSPAALTARQDLCRHKDGSGYQKEYNLLCASTPEAAAASAMRRRTEQLSTLIPEPEKDLDALADAEEWQLRELIGLVVNERMVLRPKKALLAGKQVAAPAKAFTLRGLKAKERSRRAQAPQQRYLLGEKRDATSRRVVPRTDRPSRSTPARAAGPAAAKFPASAGDILVLGLETREDRLTCNQPSKIQTLGLAVAVTYSFRTATFTAWRAEYINDLVRALLAAKLVVGYNPFGFEYKILGPYTGRNLARLPTVDLMLEITKKLGQKLPFDLITGPTLDRAWSADRSQASVFFKQGRVREVAGLCTEGVKAVRDVFLHSVEHGELLYQSGPSIDRETLEIDMRSRVDPTLIKLLRLP